MKIHKLLLTLLVSVLFFSGCKKQQLIRVCKKGPIHLSFNTCVNGEPFVLNDTLYDDYLGRKYRVELLKFYLSNLVLEKADGTITILSDVSLIDYNTHSLLDINTAVDTGLYVNLHFGIGLDSLMNTSDPADFSSSHPLSIAQNTYWTWASKYKFFMLEGRVDTLGTQSPDAIFSYHSGFDTLYKEITIPLEGLFITGDGDSLVLQFDLGTAVNGDAGLIDFVQESFSHSETDFEIVEIISSNLVNAFSINQQ